MGASTSYADTRPLHIEEIDLAPPGRDEVLIKIAAAGLCHSDLSVINGDRPPPLPMALGHEAPGVVEQLGEGVTDLQVGDHVVFVPSCGHCAVCRRAAGVVRTGRRSERRRDAALRRTASHTRRRRGVEPSPRLLRVRRVRDRLAPFGREDQSRRSARRSRALRLCRNGVISLERRVSHECLVSVGGIKDSAIAARFAYQPDRTRLRLCACEPSGALDETDARRDTKGHRTG